MIPDLTDLSHAGFTQFARQWILISRRKHYQDDGHHSLWIRCGGSAGHSSLWAVDIAEGSQTDLDGRKWEVFVNDVDQAKKVDQYEKELAKEQKKELTEKNNLKQNIPKILDALRSFPDVDTQSQIRNEAGLSGRDFQKPFSIIKESGILKMCELKKSNGRSYPTYQLKPDYRDIKTVPLGQVSIPVENIQQDRGV